MPIGLGPAPRPISRRLWRAGKNARSKALAFSAGATRYAVKTAGPGMALRGAKVTLVDFLDGTLRVRFKDRDLAFTPFKSLPAPRAGRRRQDPRRPPQAVSTDRACKGVDIGGLATARLGRASPAVIHPHPTPRHSEKGDISTWPEKGTFQLCLDRANRLGRTTTQGRFGLGAGTVITGRLNPALLTIF
jgi:hypothetical protein